MPLVCSFIESCRQMIKETVIIHYEYAGFVIFFTGWFGWTLTSEI
jgi:hypothetical protein